MKYNVEIDWNLLDWEEEPSLKSKYFNSAKMTPVLRDDVTNWLVSHCKNRWRLICLAKINVLFEDESDATAFKLAWI